MSAYVAAKTCSTQSLQLLLKIKPSPHAHNLRVSSLSKDSISITFFSLLLHTQQTWFSRFDYSADPRRLRTPTAPAPRRALRPSKSRPSPPRKRVLRSLRRRRPRPPSRSKRRMLPQSLSRRRRNSRNISPPRRSFPNSTRVASGLLRIPSHTSPSLAKM